MTGDGPQPDPAAGLAALLAMDAIRALKARYWRAVDSKDAALLRAVFTDDAITDFRDDGPPGANAHLLMQDPDGFVAQVMAVLAGVSTAHYGHAPEITLHGADDASAIWPMQDFLWVRDPASPLPFAALRGFGHYHDRYRRGPDGWKISATRLARVHIETDPRPAPPPP